MIAFFIQVEYVGKRSSCSSEDKHNQATTNQQWLSTKLHVELTV